MRFRQLDCGRVRVEWVSRRRGCPCRQCLMDSGPEEVSHLHQRYLSKILALSIEPLRRVRAATLRHFYGLL